VSAWWEGEDDGKHFMKRGKKKTLSKLRLKLKSPVRGKRKEGFQKEGKKKKKGNPILFFEGVTVASFPARWGRKRENGRIRCCPRKKKNLEKKKKKKKREMCWTGDSRRKRKGGGKLEIPFGGEGGKSKARRFQGRKKKRGTTRGEKISSRRKKTGWRSSQKGTQKKGKKNRRKGEERKKELSGEIKRRGGKKAGRRRGKKGISITNNKRI